MKIRTLCIVASALTVFTLMGGCVKPSQTSFASSGGSGGGEETSAQSLQESQDRSGQTNPGETQAGPTGTTDTGADVGFGAISG